MTAISTAAVRRHYDRLSIFYRWFWGEHLHHGLWRNGESPQEAQLGLVKELAARMPIPPGAKVLDVGCGLGGSATWLGQQFDCVVTGITISRVQKWMANKRARSLGLSKRVRFCCTDANELQFAPSSFDAVWIIECIEHLSNRGGFIENCAQLLRSGGVIGLCTWLATPAGDSSANPPLLAKICSGMLCPPLSTVQDYQAWFRESGFQQVQIEDLTQQVARTWQIGQSIVAQSLVRVCLPLLGRQARDFAAQFGPMHRAFTSGAMRYGIFTAKKK
jgi:tocopherol O-methyltransferase